MQHAQQNEISKHLTCSASFRVSSSNISLILYKAMDIIDNHSPYVAVVTVINISITVYYLYLVFGLHMTYASFVTVN